MVESSEECGHWVFPSRGEERSGEEGIQLCQRLEPTSKEVDGGGRRGIRWWSEVLTRPLAARTMMVARELCFDGEDEVSDCACENEVE
ncbi:unnamed protein product, partial [Linum tenue]